MKSPVILRVFKNTQLVEVKQFDQDQVVLGRGADVGLNLDSDDVSPIHCLIELRDSGYYLCDLGSTSGTFKNGQSILDEQLNSGDEITVGPFKISFFVGVPKPKAAPPPPQPEAPAAPEVTAAPAAAPPVMAAPPAPAPDEISQISAVSPAAHQPEVPAEVPESVVVAIPAVTPIFEPPPAKAEPKPAKVEVREEAKTESKPRITTTPVGGPGGRADARMGAGNKFRKERNRKTFAPASEVRDLREYLKPGRGPVVEVILSWKERVLNTYHYRSPGIVRLGSGEKYDINMPDGVCPIGWPLVEVGVETRVAVTAEMGVELITENGRKSIDEMVRMGKAQRSGNSITLKLEQQEMYCITMPSSDLQLYVRFAPQAPIVPVPPVFLSSSELTGMIMALVLVALLALYISATAPQAQEEKKEEIVAQVIFAKPKPTPAPVKIAEQKPEETPPPPPPPKPTPTPKKVQMAEKTKESTSRAKATENKTAAKNEKAGRAAELAPKPNSQNKPKKFSSLKQGGAIKQGETQGANAQSANKDVTKVGMLAAFGGGGMRKNLDRAYQGAGDLLGTAASATGAAGSNENRDGDDVGSKFKDTGAGGKGTATVGIAGVGTKGRGSGMGAYGAGDGLGGKNSVAIEPGGAEENFAGTIDREAVRRVIRANLKEIRGCYERELNKMGKNQKLEGKVVIKWTIVEHGRAVRASVDSSTLDNRAVENCVRDRLSTWRFPDPPPGTEAEVHYPFYFRADN